MFLVAPEGFEPSRPRGHDILSVARLPVIPPRSDATIRLSGAPGRTRTSTAPRPAGFKPAASPVPPRGPRPDVDHLPFVGPSRPPRGQRTGGNASLQQLADPLGETLPNGVHWRSRTSVSTASEWRSAVEPSGRPNKLVTAEGIEPPSPGCDPGALPLDEAAVFGFGSGQRIRTAHAGL